LFVQSATAEPGKAEHSGRAGVLHVPVGALSLTQTAPASPASGATESDDTSEASASLASGGGDASTEPSPLVGGQHRAT
jgi:hypothetical protein